MVVETAALNTVLGNMSLWLTNLGEYLTTNLGPFWIGIIAAVAAFFIVKKINSIWILGLIFGLLIFFLLYKVVGG